MITTFILTILYSFSNLVLAFLPTGTLPAGFTTALAYFWGALNAFSYIFPVSTLLAALAIVLAFDVGVMAWHFLQWVIKKIPGLH